jgi:uncharacterized protein
VVLQLGACVAKGANNPDDPRAVEARIAGFGEVGFTVRKADGLPTTTELCALLAATQQQRARGLMTVTDLRGYAGMVFRFPADTTGAFYMRNTPMPLSIAWFRADGTFVSATDMPPCEDRDGCPTYGPAGPYRYALEVPQGQLPQLGVGPGSVLSLGAGCPG